MKVLIIGGGGREHALAWKISQSPELTELYCAPGNAGIAQNATCLNIKDTDIDALVSKAIELDIDLVVVGPEAPLVLGLADRLRSEGINVFGPDQKAAELEGSKGFMKDILKKYNVPTAFYERFTDFDEASAFIKEQGAPIVVKTDGLAAGKGVLICENVEDALEAARGMLSGEAFGSAGAEIIVEEFLEGEELSYFALCDGETVMPLASAQDHKRIGEGDTGLNTGGMGAYSPARLMDEALEKAILDEVLTPTLNGMKLEGCPFTGILFAGLMIKDGKPKVIEFNIRFGDPECQVIMPRLDCDLLPILDAAARGDLKSHLSTLAWHADPALCVVMAANGYPGSYPKNTVINNVPDIQDKDMMVFHAGTARETSGALKSIGGRVLGVTAMAGNLKSAQEKAYGQIDRIDWPEGYFRRDIGWRALR